MCKHDQSSVSSDDASSEDLSSNESSSECDDDLDSEVSLSSDDSGSSCHELAHPVATRRHSWQSICEQIATTHRAVCALRARASYDSDYEDAVGEAHKLVHAMQECK